MNWLRKCRGRLRALFLQQKLDAEMEEEMRWHVDLQTREYMEGGMGPDEAKRRACREFGRIEHIKEECREQRGVSWIANLLRDVRFSCRRLVTQPAFSLLSIGVLGIGIAGTTTVFSLFNALCLRPLPVPHQDRLVDLSERDLHTGDFAAMAYPHFDAWRKHNGTFDSMAACSFWGANLTSGDKAERVSILLITHDYFDVLGLRPLLGRGFTEEEDRPGGPAVALLSYHFWERVFAKDASIVGGTVRLDKDVVAVIGVLPPEAAFPLEKDLWRPLCADPEKGHGGLGTGAFGCLKQGVTLEQARADLARIQNGWSELQPDQRVTVPMVRDFRETYLSGYRFGLSILLGVVGFVLLIACSNVASLMLARAAHRSREIAVRIVLGASRQRIVQYVLSESLVLSLFGSLWGVLAGYAALRAIVISLADQIPSWLKFTLDLRFACWMALGVGVVTGLSGLLPALDAWRGSAKHNSLQSMGRNATSSRHRLRILDGIVVGQIALALTLLIGAGLLLRTFLNVQRVEPGFQVERVLTYQIPLPIGPYFDEHKRRLFFGRHLEEVRTLPGVKQATLCTSLPFAFLDLAQFETEGMSDSQQIGSSPPVVLTSVAPGYFETLSIPLLSGRSLNDWDNRQDSARSVLVNQAFADRFWPGEAAIGKRIRRAGSLDWTTVVGVTRNVRIQGLEAPTCPAVYQPYGWHTPFVMVGAVRVAGNPLSIVPAIRDLVRAADPELPVVEVQTMSERIRQSLWTRRVLAWLVGVPSLAAALMACTGIFGVISYSVSQRLQEFGIRLALGARPMNLVWLVVRGGLIRIGAGMTLGLGAALGLTRVLRSLLFGVETMNLLTYGSVALLLGAVALAACCAALRRAAKVDPVTVLRCD